MHWHCCRVTDWLYLSSKNILNSFLTSWLRTDLWHVALWIFFSLGLLVLHVAEHWPTVSLDQKQLQQQWFSYSADSVDCSGLSQNWFLILFMYLFFTAKHLHCSDVIVFSRSISDGAVIYTDFVCTLNSCSSFHSIYWFTINWYTFQSVIHF